MGISSLLNGGAPPEFNYVSVQVSNLEPDRGKEGDKIFIRGHFFSLDPAENIVEFSGGSQFDPVLATVVQADTNLLEVVVPEGGQTGDVFVTVDGHRASGPQFTYQGDVFISELEPDHGRVGDEVKIIGENFAVDLTQNLVEFPGGISVDPISGDLSSLLVKVPEGQ